MIKESSIKPVILIVDDNPKNLQVLGNLLQIENYKIEFAISGEVALEWLTNKRFDLILLDINMPGMNGFEVCKKIRSNPQMNKVPVIFLSAESERESILKGFEEGAQDYVTKPFDSRELLARVRTHLALKDSLENLENLNLSLEEKVTERTLQLKETNDKLEVANIKLKELDKAKADFLRMISHQIRTPLNGVVGSIQIFNEFKESEVMGKMIKMLDESVKKLEQFSINALLITEIRTEGDRISKENIILSNLIDKCLEDNDISDQISNMNIRMQVSDIPSEIKLYGNQRLLQTAIINVLDNAIKFSKPDGVIQLNVIKNDNSVVLGIIDQGEGFLEKSLSTINKLLSSDDLPINPNLGLGLNLVKLIMDFHAGKVEVKNNVDAGASVNLLFNLN